MLKKVIVSVFFVGLVALITTANANAQAEIVPARTLSIAKTVNRTSVEVDSDNNRWTYSIRAHNEASCTVPINAAVVFDRSGSMDDDGLNPPQPLTNAKIAVGAFLDAMNPTKDKIGIVSYSDDARVDSYLTNDFASLKGVVAGLNPNGFTNIADGINKGIEVVQGSANPIIVVFTDGVANRPGSVANARAQALNAASTAKSQGIQVLAIGLGKAADLDLLTQIASPGMFYYAPDSLALIEIFAALAKSLQGISPSTVIQDDITPLLSAGKLVDAGGGTLANNVVNWYLGDLVCGETREVGFTMEAMCPVSSTGNYLNQASVFSKVQSTVVSNQVGVDILAPNVSASLSHAGTLFQPGAELTFSVVLTNNGSGQARNVRAVATLPEFLTPTTNLDWTVFLAAGETKELQFRAVVNANIPDGYTTTYVTLNTSYLCGSLEASDAVQLYKFTPPAPDYDVYAYCVEQKGDKKFVYLGYDNRLNVTQELTTSEFVPSVGSSLPLKSLLPGKKDKAQVVTLPVDMAEFTWHTVANDYAKQAKMDGNTPNCADLVISVPPITTLPPIDTIVGTPIVDLPASPDVTNFPPTVSIANLDTAGVCTEKRAYLNSCDIFDRDGQIVAAQYSLDAGNTWYPITEITNLGQSAASCKVITVPLHDGNYDLRVRAFDNNGNVASSNNIKFNVDCQGIVIGSSQFNQRGILSPMNNSGTVQSYLHEQQYMAIDIAGGPDKVIVRTEKPEYKREFELKYNTHLELWEGNLEFNEPGVYDLLVIASEASGLSTQRYTNSVEVIRPGRVIDELGRAVDGSKLSIFYRPNKYSDWQIWNGGVFRRENPVVIADNAIDLVFEPGNYYLVAENAGYFATVTKEFEVTEYSFLTSDITMFSQANIFSWFDSQAYPVSVTSIQDWYSPGLKKLLQEQLPNISLSNGEKTLTGQDIIDSHKLTVLATWTDWDTPSSAQWQNIMKLFATKPEDVELLAVGLLEGREENESVVNRGEYKFPIFKPVDLGFFDNLQIVSAPQYYLIDQTGTIRDIKVGPILPEQLWAFVDQMRLDHNSQE
ncbi:MAG: VWA domain-containing protein [Candidatus Doudnabacteria bacterium]|nr:VWA domain-containing protein [Candidatus Doudnabacteria bacterium]